MSVMPAKPRRPLITAWPKLVFSTESALVPPTGLIRQTATAVRKASNSAIAQIVARTMTVAGLPRRQSHHCANHGADAACRDESAFGGSATYEVSLRSSQYSVRCTESWPMRSSANPRAWIGEVSCFFTAIGGAMKSLLRLARSADVPAQL